ncbi:MAG TPA: type II toxin-antitoxin system RelE/ParE family toxin [Rectinemataceae bacterium]|nr:type II toxin-antitoxin system RelE/ParE family toxin [Rectinemataceae bacterium]
MAWAIEFAPDVAHDLHGLDRPVRERILRFIHERLVSLDDPRTIGEALKGQRFGNLWHYRVGDYRVIAELVDARLVILVVSIGHRREVYR